MPIMLELVVAAAPDIDPAFALEPADDLASVGLGRRHRTSLSAHYNAHCIVRTIASLVKRPGQAVEESRWICRAAAILRGGKATVIFVPSLSPGPPNSLRRRESVRRSVKADGP